MSIQKRDENGVYRPYDFNTGQFLDEDEYPLASNLGQIEHQTIATSQGRVVDIDSKNIDVIDNETGLAVTSEDELIIKNYIKEAISIDNLVETFNDNSHETLLKLLALQDNKRPLKKGGIGIAYRTDALIMHCKMEFTAEENVVFDAILGTMSTYPENKSYHIQPSSFQQYSKYQNKKTLLNTFNKGTQKLTERHLVFGELGPNGEDELIIPWFNILRYHKATKTENAFIEFVPSDFFKDLALCSGLVHGAFGSLEVTTQLQGKYTIALYWYLENMKKYKAYPAATPGVFEMTLDEFRHQFSLPASYKKRADYERRVLEPAKVSINSVAECDFTFDYEARFVDDKLAGFKFEIKEKNYIEGVATEIEEIEESQDGLFEEFKMILMIFKVEFADDEIQRIVACARRNNKDSEYMTDIIKGYKQRVSNPNLDPIEDKVGYICRMIEQGANPKAAVPEKKKNKFNNFSQRDYDMDKLEAKLLWGNKGGDQVEE